MAIRFTEAALDKLSEAGFDPVYGARPLKRVIQSRVENGLANAILQGDYVAGDRIVVDGDETGFSFDREAIEEPA